MASRPLRLGTRGSPLALAQSRQVARALEAAHAGLEVQLVAISTRGDRLPGDLAPLGGKGLFTAELEEGLASSSLDLAVHSLKDVPAALPPGLALAAFPPRADPRDALISELAATLEELPRGAQVLTGALRRRAQLLAARPDLEVLGVRGNVGTRLARWRQSGVAAVVLALAGLERLSLADLPAHPLDPERFVPAPGQGILAVETRQGSEAEALCRALDHGPTAQAARAERALVAALGGDCSLPLGAWCHGEEDSLRLVSVLATPDGRRLIRAEASGTDPEALATACAQELDRLGAQELLAEIRAPR